MSTKERGKIEKRPIFWTEEAENVEAYKRLDEKLSYFLISHGPRRRKIFSRKFQKIINENAIKYDFMVFSKSDQVFIFKLEK